MLSSLPSAGRRRGTLMVWGPAPYSASRWLLCCSMASTSYLRGWQHQAAAHSTAQQPEYATKPPAQKKSSLQGPAKLQHGQHLIPAQVQETPGGSTQHGTPQHTSNHISAQHNSSPEQHSSIAKSRQHIDVPVPDFQSLQAAAASCSVVLLHAAYAAAGCEACKEAATSLPLPKPAAAQAACECCNTLPCACKQPTLNKSRD